MKPQFTQMFSEKAMRMKASEIRELLKLTARPEIISFAGGLPNPDAFPFDTVEMLTQKVVREDGREALQYGTTEGVQSLRKGIAERLNAKGADINYDNVLITHGSQQGLTILSNALIDKNDLIFLSDPTYLGAVSAFRENQAKMQAVALNGDGMDLDDLEEKLLHAHKQNNRIKFIYVMPTFHNPTGVTMPEENRKRLVDIAEDRDVIIVEDDPYSELRYKGEDIKPIKSFDKNGRVVYLGTFSKVLCPGFRIAWMVAEHELLNKFTLAKQPLDLCTNTFGQCVASRYINDGYIDTHIEKIKAIYSEKLDIMLGAMEDHFPEWATWTKPEGGMFTWVTLPEKFDAKEMFPRAIEEKVAYVNGAAFSPDSGCKNNMRLNFSYSTNEEILTGIQRLAKVLRMEKERLKDVPEDEVPMLQTP